MKRERTRAPLVLAAVALCVWFPLDVDEAQCGEPVTLASGESFPAALAVDGTHVYWLANPDGPDVVRKVPKVGGTSVTLAFSDSVFFLAVDDTHVFWTDGSGHKVLNVPKAGGAVTVLSDAEGRPVPLEPRLAPREVGASEQLLFQQIGH